MEPFLRFVRFWLLVFGLIFLYAYEREIQAWLGW